MRKEEKKNKKKRENYELEIVRKNHPLPSCGSAMPPTNTAVRVDAGIARRAREILVLAVWDVLVGRVDAEGGKGLSCTKNGTSCKGRKTKKTEREREREMKGNKQPIVPIPCRHKPKTT